MKIPKRPGINVGNHRHFFSIQKVKDAIFSRRYGHRGLIIRNHSVLIRVFGFDLTTWLSKKLKQLLKVTKNERKIL